MSNDDAGPSTEDLTLTNRGRSYVLGHGGDFYGVWDRTKQGAPVARFPRTDDGWQEALRYYTELEKRRRHPLNRRVSGPMTFGVLVLLLSAVLFVAAFVDPRLNIPVISKVTCSMHGGTWTDGSVVWGIPAGCYSVSPI